MSHRTAGLDRLPRSLVAARKKKSEAFSKKTKKGTVVDIPEAFTATGKKLGRMPFIRQTAIYTTFSGSCLPSRSLSLFLLLCCPWCSSVFFPLRVHLYPLLLPLSSPRICPFSRTSELALSSFAFLLGFVDTSLSILSLLSRSAKRSKESLEVLRTLAGAVVSISSWACVSRQAFLNSSLSVVLYLSSLFSSLRWTFLLVFLLRSTRRGGPANGMVRLLSSLPSSFRFACQDLRQTDRQFLFSSSFRGLFSEMSRFFLVPWTSSLLVCDRPLLLCNRLPRRRLGDFLPLFFLPTSRNFFSLLASCPLFLSLFSRVLFLCMEGGSAMVEDGLYLQRSTYD